MTLQIQILSPVVLSTFLRQEKKFFLAILSVQVCMCTSWNSHTDKVKNKKRPLIIEL